MSLEYSWGSAGFGEKGKKGTFVWGGPASCHDNGPGAALQVRLDPGTGGRLCWLKTPRAGSSPLHVVRVNLMLRTHTAPQGQVTGRLCLKRTYSRGWLCLPDDIETDLYQGGSACQTTLKRTYARGGSACQTTLKRTYSRGGSACQTTLKRTYARGGSACQTTLKRTYARGGSACQTTLTRRSATSWNKHCANRTCTRNPSIAQPEHQVQRHGCNQQAAPRHL